MRDRPSTAAVVALINRLTSMSCETSVKGIPIARFGYSAAMLNQKISCTSTGVPLKKVTYAPARIRTGLQR